MRYEYPWFDVKDEGERTIRIRQDRVQKLIPQSPQEARIVLRGKLQDRKIVFTGYENSLILGTEDGRPVRYNIKDVKALDAGAWAEGFKQVGEVIGHGEEMNVDEKMGKGHVSFVHFHSKESEYSVKMQAYLSRLATMSGNEVMYFRIDILNQQAPILQQYEIRTLPEIWVYDKEARCIKKLGETPTPRDIDAALEEARGMKPAP